MPADWQAFFLIMTEIFEISVTDWTGYLASVLVLSSFLMKNIRKLRTVNILGCVTFVIYGFMLNSWPVIITNVAIAGVNFYYLIFGRK